MVGLLLCLVKADPYCFGYQIAAEAYIGLAYMRASGAKDPYPYTLFQ